MMLTLRSGKKVLWGSGERSADKAQVLQALVKARGDVGSYDVSAPGRSRRRTLIPLDPAASAPDPTRLRDTRHGSRRTDPEPPNVGIRKCILSKL
ncbi:hypothetical protein [Clavibacter zhangzhiyongii]|uniref:hypothetical protein n=1 Tax=Clavibacter zhangzhiyongii TaxID=2768071 RepID=UPI0039E1C2A9